MSPQYAFQSPNGWIDDSRQRQRSCWKVLRTISWHPSVELNGAAAANWHQWIRLSRAVADAGTILFETLTCFTIFSITTCRAGCLFELSGLIWQIRYVCVVVYPFKSVCVPVNLSLPPLQSLSLLAFGAQWSKTTVTQLQLQLWFQESLFQSRWFDLTLLFRNSWLICR